MNMKEIQEVIAEIELKISGMRSSLDEVQTENGALRAEVQVLKEQLSQREQEAIDFQNKYNDLMRQQAEIPQERNSFSVDKDAEIDALVREIDDCINRLKA